MEEDYSGAATFSLFISACIDRVTGYTEKPMLTTINSLYSDHVSELLHNNLNYENKTFMESISGDRVKQVVHCSVSYLKVCTICIF